MTIAIFILLCLAQAADAYTTLRAAKAGAVEANPVLIKLFGKRPREALLVLKAAITAVIAYALHGMGWQAGNDYVTAMIVLSLIMGYAAHNNWRIIQRLEK